MEILIGADPEIFVKKDGQFVSAHGLIEGSKEAPKKVDKGAVQVDGMALEFNIDPARSEEEFVTNINTVLGILSGMVPEYELAKATPTAVFTQEYMDTQPEEAKLLGCDPDFSAYTKKANGKPNGDRPMRTAAGHVHIGIGKFDTFSAQHIDLCSMITKELDVALGIPSLLMDNDDLRRQMYGKAGAFRPKPYGLEYRVLSNFWVGNDDLAKWVYNTTVQTVTRIANGEFLANNVDANAIINKNDKASAHAFVLDLGYCLPI